MKVRGGANAVVKLLQAFSKGASFKAAYHQERFSLLEAITPGAVFTTTPAVRPGALAAKSPAPKNSAADPALSA